MNFHIKIIRSLYCCNKWNYFIVICLLLSYFTFWNFYFYYTEEILIRTYSNQISYERIISLLSNGRNSLWITILLLPIIVSLRLLFTSLSLSAGGFFAEARNPFMDYFNISLKAELVVILMYFTKWIFIEFIWDIRTLNDLSIIPISLYHYFAKSNLPLWSTAALSYANIWEVLYILIIAGMLGVINNKPLKSNVLFVLSTYGVALVFWIVILTYIAITLT